MFLLKGIRTQTNKFSSAIKIKAFVVTPMKFMEFFVIKGLRQRLLLYIDNYFRLDDNQTMPPLFDDRIEQEYGKEKFEELKSNPKLKSYFKEMFTNRNRPFRGKSHV